MTTNISTQQQEDWNRSDAYHNKFLVNAAPSTADRADLLARVVERNRKAGLPDIAVSEAQGKFLHLLAKTFGARRILEVGTLGGYSTIWLAKALPEDGRVLTFEIDEHNATVAKENFKDAGLSEKISVILGPAADKLPEINTDQGHFDLVFIDADKPSNLIYFQHAERLVRPGGVIIVDNVVRGGRVANPEIQDDENVKGVRKLLEYVQKSETVDAVTLATVGSKGYDGFMYALRK